MAVLPVLRMVLHVSSSTGSTLPVLYSSTLRFDFCAVNNDTITHLLFFSREQLKLIITCIQIIFLRSNYSTACTTTELDQGPLALLP